MMTMAILTRVMVTLLTAVMAKHHQGMEILTIIVMAQLAHVTAIQPTIAMALQVQGMAIQFILMMAILAQSTVTLGAVTNEQ
jgi:hypothetical protein